MTNPNRNDRLKLLRRWAPRLISLGLAVSMVVILTRSGILQEIDFRTLQWDFLVLLLVLRVIHLVIRGYMLAIFVRHSGVHLTVTEWFSLASAGLLTNLATPIAGGAIVRAGYLKLRHGFPVSQYSAFAAATTLLNWLVGGIVGLIILAGLALAKRQPIPLSVVAVLLSLVIVPVLVLSLSLERLPLPGKGRIMRWVQRALDGWNRVRTSRSLLVRMVVLVTLTLGIQTGSHSLGLLGVGQGIPYVDMLLITILTNVVRVTPFRGWFGLREIIAGVAAQMVGRSMAQGVTAALLLRLSNWILAVVSGSVSLPFLSHKLGKPVGDLKASEIGGAEPVDAGQEA